MRGDTTGIRETRTYEERMWRINNLEILAMKFAFQTFLKDQNLTSYSNGKNDSFDLPKKWGMQRIKK